MPSSQARTSDAVMSSSTDSPIQAGGWSESIDHLNAFAAEPDGVPQPRRSGSTRPATFALDVWLEQVQPLADAEPHEFGKEGSFEALVRWFAAE